MPWSLEKIQALIAAQIEEDSHLEYKAADALTPSEGKKVDISKDVSSFANSDGGVIIYGICEINHLPERMDPVNRRQVSRESLEQIINSRISPRIHGLALYPVVADDAKPDAVIYVVEIPKGNTAHQASDKRYYRRFNFVSTPMEDWEIKDIINRQVRTSAEVRLLPKFNAKYEFGFHTQAGKTFGFDIIARNTGIKAIMLLDCLIATPEEKVARQFVQPIPFNHRSRVHEVTFNNGYTPPSPYAPLLPPPFPIPREPILSHTWAKIGEADIYSDFFIQEMPIQITVVTEDNRSTRTFRGKELIIDNLGDG